MLHLLLSKNPFRIFCCPSTSQNEKRTGKQPPWVTNRHLSISWCLLIILLSVIFSHAPILWANSVWAGEKSSTTALNSQKDQQALQDVKTILVTGTIQTWLDVPAPPYNVGVTLKLKLEDAGYQVVFDPQQPHDVTLRIQYQEIPSGQFRVLEEATAVNYHMQLVHDGLGEVFVHRFEARPNAIPVGSLYWDTIGNLEEDPYYCFVGDLIHGYLHGNQNEEDILVEVLVRPFMQEDMVNAAGSRGATQIAVQQRARLNLIQALGQGPFDTPKAEEALWTVAKKGQPNERGAAYTQLGKIGDASFLSPLTALLEKEKVPEVQSAAEHAIHLIESR